MLINPFPHVQFRRKFHSEMIIQKSSFKRVCIVTQSKSYSSASEIYQTELFVVESDDSTDSTECTPSASFYLDNAQDGERIKEQHEEIEVVEEKEKVVDGVEYHQDGDILEHLLPDMTQNYWHRNSSYTSPGLRYAPNKFRMKYSDKTRAAMQQKGDQQLNSPHSFDESPSLISTEDSLDHHDKSQLTTQIADTRSKHSASGHLFAKEARISDYGLEFDRQKMDSSNVGRSRRPYLQNANTTTVKVCSHEFEGGWDHKQRHMNFESEGSEAFGDPINFSPAQFYDNSTSSKIVTSHHGSSEQQTRDIMVQGISAFDNELKINTKYVNSNHRGDALQEFESVESVAEQNHSCQERRSPISHYWPFQSEQLQQTCQQHMKHYPEGKIHSLGLNSRLYCNHY